MSNKKVLFKTAKLLILAAVLLYSTKLVASFMKEESVLPRILKQQWRAKKKPPNPVAEVHELDILDTILVHLYLGWILSSDYFCGTKKVADDWFRVAKEGNLVALNFLAAKAWVDINMAGEDGCTALHLSAQGGYLEAVKYLVEQGADVSVKNKAGATAANCANARGYYTVTAFLALQDLP